MRSSWFVNLSLLLLTGCVSVKPTGLVREPEALLPRPAATYTAPEGSTLYKATLEVKDHTLTGLLVIKKMTAPPAPATYRVVFASEVGMTFFDLELREQNARWISCFPSLKKRALLKIFEHNFRMLTWESILLQGEVFHRHGNADLVVAGPGHRAGRWHTFTPAGDTLKELAASSSAANAVEITFGRYADAQPGLITLTNPLIGMKMTLKKLK